MDQKLSMLAKVPLLAGLERKDLELVARLADEVDVPAGRRLVTQGDLADAFYLILEGTVAIDRDGARISDLGPGDFFGELAMLSQIPRMASATATTPCRLLVVGHREFNSLLADFPSVQGAILHAVAQRVASLEPNLPH